MTAARDIPWQSVVDLAPAALILVDATGQLLYANGEARRLFDGTAAGLARFALAAQPPATATAGWSGMSRTVVRRTDDTDFPVESRSVHVATAGGPVTAMALYDLSEHQRGLDAVVVSREAAERANEGKTRFLTAASHDLRQPLQTLRLLNSALQRQQLPGVACELVRQQEHALDSVSALVERVLNVSKLESGTVEPKVESLPVARLFADIVEAYGLAAQAKSLELSAALTGGYVRTDPVLLRQLVENLVSNAVRYTDHGHVRLSAAPLDGQWQRLVVEDSGLGIPASALPSIFDDFAQVARPGHPTRGGFGLGLGTVRRIAVLLGLRVGVESSVGSGSRFWVDVPGGEPAVEPAGHAPAASRTNANRVAFLIEDEPAVRQALTMLLKFEGYRVAAAASLAEVGQLLAPMDAPPTVVISDYQLSDGEIGTDGIRLIRSKFGVPVPAIVLTGDTSRVTVSLDATECTVLLNKPVTVDQLMEAVRSLPRND